MFLVIFLLMQVSPAAEEAPKPPQGVELLFPIDDGAVPKDKKKKDAKAEKAAKRQAALLKKLKAIEKGGDINAADKNGQTALMQAAAANNRLAVCWLVAKGAKATLKNKKGKTARDLSSSIAIRELLRLAANEKKPLTEEEKLRYHVADKPTKDILQQNLRFAVPYVEDLANLIKMGAKPTAWDVDGTPILEPMEGEKASPDEQAAPESIAWLTRKGVDFTKRGKDGKWTGSQHLPPAALRFLLALGVKPDLQKDDPLVCLQAALEGDAPPGIRAALEKAPKDRMELLGSNVHSGTAMKALLDGGLNTTHVVANFLRNGTSAEALDVLLNAGFPLIESLSSDEEVLASETGFLLRYVARLHCGGLFPRLISAGVDPNGDYVSNAWFTTPSGWASPPCSSLLELTVKERHAQALRELLAAGAKLPEKQNPLSSLTFFKVPKMTVYTGDSRTPYIDFPTRGIAQLSSWRTECEYSLEVYDIIDTLVKAGCPVPNSLPLRLMNSFIPSSQLKQCPDLPPAMVDLFASPEKLLRFSLKLCGDKAPQDALVNPLFEQHVTDTDPSAYEQYPELSSEQLASIANILLDAGADPSATHPSRKTTLMLAGSTDASLAKRLLDAGANLSAKDVYGVTALHTARNVKTAQALLDAGANVQDAEQRVRILEYVIRQPNAAVPELCRFWKAHGAKFDADLVEHLLPIAFWGIFTVDTYLEILKFLADGSDIASYQSPVTKQSFLHNAAGHVKSIERVQALLKAGANINVRDKDGKTPLMYVDPRWPETLRFLIKNGADVNAQDNDGNTYMMQNIDELYFEETCPLLLDSGARTDIKNKDGKTALQLAREKKNEKVVKLLEERGVKE